MYRVFNDDFDQCFEDYEKAEHFASMNACAVLDDTDGAILDDYREGDDSDRMWVSYYLQDGTQTGATMPKMDIDEAERILQKTHGSRFGGIADYGYYNEEDA